MLAAEDECLSEVAMGVAPVIKRADAYLEILGDFLVGGAEAAEVVGLIGIGGVVGHIAGIGAVT
jgi:hypothetical protein